jgi:hypothetical protein
MPFSLRLKPEVTSEDEIEARLLTPVQPLTGYEPYPRAGTPRNAGDFEGFDFKSSVVVTRLNPQNALKQRHDTVRASGAKRVRISKPSRKERLSYLSSCDPMRHPRAMKSGVKTPFDSPPLWRWFSSSQISFAAHASSVCREPFVG